MRRDTSDNKEGQDEVSNERGVIVVIGVIITAITFLAIVVFFLIKRYEVEWAVNKEYELATQNASETLFRKYTYLTKRGDKDENDWKKGALAEAYDLKPGDCISPSSSASAESCTKGKWTLKPDMPYTISLVKGDYYNRGLWTYYEVPPTLTYETGKKLIDPNSSGILNQPDCIGLRLENIPVNYFMGSISGSSNPGKKVWGQVILVEKSKDENGHALGAVKVCPEVFSTIKQIPYPQKNS